MYRRHLFPHYSRSHVDYGLRAQRLTIIWSYNRLQSDWRRAIERYELTGGIVVRQRPFHRRQTHKGREPYNEFRRELQDEL